MLWVYPVLDGLLTRAVKQPSPQHVQRIEKAAAVSQVGRAAYQRYTGRRAPDHEESPHTAQRDSSGGHESLLSAATLSALQEIRAVDAEVMVYAMIAAAQADGRVDDDERRRIFTHLHTLTSSPDERDAVQALLDVPVTLDSLLARVTSPEMALEVYTASRLIVDPPSPVESAYLGTLAQRLHLNPADIARYQDKHPLHIRAPED